MWTQISVFLIILAAMAAYGGLHSWLASLQAKALARRNLGSAADRLYRLAYNFVAVISLLPVLVIPAMLPDQPLYVIPFHGRCSACWFRAGSAGVAGRSAPNRPVVIHRIGAAAGSSRAPDARIGGRGLYQWVRHPLYTAGLVFIWLTPVMTWNVLALNIGLSLYLFIGALFEERKLLREFGQEYQNYQKCTPMFFPGLLRRDSGCRR